MARQSSRRKGDALNNSTFLNYATFNESNVDLTLMECGYEKCDPNHFWEGAKSFHIIHVILSGRGTLETGGRRFELGAGQGFYLQAGQQALYTADEDEPWEYRWVGCLGTHGVPALSATVLPKSTVFTSRDIGLYDRRFAQIYLYSAQGTQEGKYRALGQLYTLFADLLSEFRDKTTRQDSSIADEYVDKAVRFIRNSYDKPLSIEMLCRHISVTRSYLYKLFVRRFGISPTEYLIKYRLERARELAQGGFYTVESLAEAAGFNSHAYFTKCFRKMYGCTPRDYIRQLHKGEDS